VDVQHNSVCPDLAAIFVFSASDGTLFRQFAQQQPGLSAPVLKHLEATLFTPEKDRLIINAINTQGSITWGMSLPLHQHAGDQSQPQHEWFAPFWTTCPTKACQWLPLREGTNVTFRYMPCEICQEAQFFFASWVASAWRSLQGLYRKGDDGQNLFDMFREEQIIRFASSHPNLKDDHSSNPRTPPRIALWREHQYQVVRHIDIATPPAHFSREQPSTDNGSSWVDTLRSIDPQLVVEEEREVPQRTRRLRHPRYAKYRQEHGTDQVEVRAHTKTVLLRNDPRRITKVTAKKIDQRQSQKVREGEVPSRDQDISTGM
jgi:hypothetical protein